MDLFLNWESVVFLLLLLVLLYQHTRIFKKKITGRVTLHIESREKDEKHKYLPAEQTKLYKDCSFTLPPVPSMKFYTGVDYAEIQQVTLHESGSDWDFSMDCICYASIEDDEFKELCEELEKEEGWKKTAL